MSPSKKIAAARALADDDELFGGDLYHLLVDRVRDYAIFALDIDGVVRTWNSGAQRLKQYAAHEIIGRHFSTFYTPEDRLADRPGRLLRTAAEVGRAEDEGWGVRKDGALFWANVLITAVRSDSGQLLGFAKVTRDLTDKLAAAEHVRQTEERFSLLVQSVKDYAIFMLDPTGHVTTWNTGAERIKGYTAEEIEGRHFSTFYTREDVESGKPERELRIAVAEGRYEEEGWRVRKDGSLLWASVVITPILTTPLGELAGFAKVTRDLTEQRAAFERALEAESANRTKSAFLAAMSHELRTPLNAIGGYTELMRMELSGPLTEAQRVQLDRIHRSQQHLLGIINDLLNFTRMEAGQVEYEITAVPVDLAVRDVVAMIEVQATTNDVTLSVSHCTDDLVAAADAAKLEQILLNLLSNAIKFTPAGGSVEVSCGREGENVRVAVRDTGIGIPAGHIDTIFAPFVQVGRSFASPKEGTGLGLAISRDLARAMDGELTVRSVEGTGSTFTLTLPAAADDGLGGAPTGR